MVKRKRGRVQDGTLSPTVNDTSSPSCVSPPPLSLPDLAPHRLPLPLGEVYYIPEFLSSASATSAYSSLTSLDTWEHPLLKVYGKVVRQSRASAVYATSAEVEMKYSGTEIAAHHPLPPVVDDMRRRVEALVGPVSVCMLNKYDGGEVYIGKHSDTPDNEMIASVSLGAERTFVFSPREPRRGAGTVQAKTPKLKRQNVKLKLGNGSLVVMAGMTQEYWKHEIPKELKVKEGRISLTFRRLRGGESKSPA